MPIGSVLFPDPPARERPESTSRLSSPGPVRQVPPPAQAPMQHPFAPHAIPAFSPLKSAISKTLFCLQYRVQFFSTGTLPLSGMRDHDSDNFSQSSILL